MDDKDYAYYLSKLQIDKNALDSALIEQPQLIQDVGEWFVEAVSVRDELYDEVQRVDADLDFEERQKLEKELGKKPTESMVQSAIQIHEEHIDARAEYLSAKKAAENWRTLRDSFIERSKALRELASLYVSGYFAVDSTSGKDPDEVVSDANKRRYKDKRKSKGNGRKKAQK